MKTTAPVIGATVLAIDAITKLSQAERIDRFAGCATVSKRVFSEMGKLLFVISANLKGTQTIYEVLRKVGVKDGTISNACYASKAFDLVQEGAIREEEYNEFTFQDCFAIARVTGSNSRKRLSREEVADIIRATVPHKKTGTIDFAPELNCIYEFGVTREEKAENDRLIAEAARLEEEEEKKRQAEAEAQRIADAAGKASPTTPETTAGPGAPNNPAPNIEIVKPEAQAAAPVAPAPPQVIEMPKTPRTAADAMHFLDQVETILLDLSEEDIQLVGARIVSMAEIVFAFAEKKSGTTIAKAA